jgi:NTE family protein
VGVKVRLALSSGSALGFVHIGVIRAILKLGGEITEISGSSMGAVVSSFFAFGFSPERMLDVADEVGGRFTTFLKAALGSRGMPVISLEDIVRRYLGGRRIADAHIPLYIYATDLKTGEPYIFSGDDDVVTALKASTAIPGVFPWVKYRGMLLVDGGVASPLPTSVFSRSEEGLVVAVNVYAGARNCPWSPPRLPFLSDVSALLRSYSLIMDRMTSIYASGAHVVLTPPLCQFNSLDFGKARAIADVGYRYAMRYLSGLL